MLDCSFLAALTSSPASAAQILLSTVGVETIGTDQVTMDPGYMMLFDAETEKATVLVDASVEAGTGIDLDALHVLTFTSATDFMLAFSTDANETINNAFCGDEDLIQLSETV